MKHVLCIFNVGKKSSNKMRSVRVRTNGNEHSAKQNGENKKKTYSVYNNMNVNQ